MFRLALPVLSLLATPALAHPGLHHHPHGIELGWVAAVLAGSVTGGGAVWLWLRGRR